jgi:hypothetical protein
MQKILAMLPSQGRGYTIPSQTVGKLCFVFSSRAPRRKARICPLAKHVLAQPTNLAKMLQKCKSTEFPPILCGPQCQRACWQAFRLGAQHKALSCMALCFSVLQTLLYLIDATKLLHFTVKCRTIFYTQTLIFVV